MLKHGILGLLCDRNLTGYEIMETFRDSLNYFWDAKTSQIYRELQKLEQNGWVSKVVVPQTGKPDKNVFSITEAGRAELLRWLSDGDQGLRVNTPLLMKAFFLGEQPVTKNLEFFSEVEKRSGRYLEKLESLPGFMEDADGPKLMPGKAMYWQMTIDYGKRHLQMQIQWAKDCIRRLSREDLPGDLGPSSAPED